MTAETISSLIFTGPLTWTDRGRLPGPDAAVLRAGRRAPRGPGRARVAGPRRVPRVPRARRSAATGPASTASTASGAPSPKKSAPPPASASTCPSAGSPATRVATASPSRRASPASRNYGSREHVGARRDGLAPTTRACNLPAVTDTPPGVDLERLRPWFAAHVDGATGGAAHRVADLRRPLEPHLRDPRRRRAHEWVLRRPPLGHVLPTAHDMAREYKVLTALAPTDVPVPADARVLRRRRGQRRALLRDGARRRRHPAHRAPTSPRSSHDDARRCSEELIDVLVAIHAVDYDAVGLGDFGHPDGYVERQVRRWGEQWERSKTRELPAVDELARRLRAAIPESPPPTIVHGDYRLDNTMLAPDDPGRDRRGARLGDGDARRSARRPRPLPPLLTCATRRRPATSARRSRPTPGFLPRDDVVERYAKQSGRDVSQLDFYEALAAYKLAIILEGIHARYLMGKTRRRGLRPHRLAGRGRWCRARSTSARGRRSSSISAADVG